MQDDNKKLTYAGSGVDRNLRAQSKTGLVDLQKTYGFSKNGPPIKLPYGMITPIGDGRYQDHVIEGVGTKVLIAQLADRYDTIGVDSIAMAVNDVIRSGAVVTSLSDNIDLQKSEPYFVNELMKGLLAGATESEAPLVGGEIADVPTLINGIRENRGFHIVASALGEVYATDIIRGNRISSGDVVIGLSAPNQHSNGVSLVRRTLFKKWGGVYEPQDIPDGLEKSVADEVLEPTRIYVKHMKRVHPAHGIKAAVHITGDAYLKFDKLQEVNPGIGFEFDNFAPPPIYKVLQDAAKKMNKEIEDEEMFKTFNMGWGFAIVTHPGDVNRMIDAMGEGEPIGRVTKTGDITIKFRGRTIDLKR